MLLDLGFLILLAIVAAGLGLRLLGWLRLVPAHPIDAWSLAVPLGLGERVDSEAVAQAVRAAGMADSGLDDAATIAQAQARRK